MTPRLDYCRARFRGARRPPRRGHGVRISVRLACMRLSGRVPVATMPQITFYFDLGSPFAYLAAERLDEILREPITWQPVSLGALFKLTERSSWALGDPSSRQAGMAEVERRAHSYDLAPMRWPDPWPTNYLYAMRAATYAFRAGHGRPFTMAAFRHAFAHGHDLAIPEHVQQVAAQ